MGLIPSQDCQKIGIQEAILKRNELRFTNIDYLMGNVHLKSKEENLL